MNFSEIPKRIKITQSLLLLFIYFLACIWANGSFAMLNAVSLIFLVLSILLSLFHYVSGDKYLSFNNICLGGLIYIIFAFLC